MDIYSRKSRWKIYLFIAGAIILIISLFYTRYIATELAKSERAKVSLYADALTIITDSNDADLEQNMTFFLNVVKVIEDIPVILVNETGDISESQNFPENADLEKELEKIKKDGLPPIEGTGYNRFIYYKHTQLLSLLKYFPWFQLLLITVFIAASYLLFSSARRAEQNQVWVGMAKETAHQLGTPISAIVAWIQHLSAIREGDEEVQEVLVELQNDVNRLELVADRFSKIGSAPKLETINIFDELEKCRAYMQRRAPRRVNFQFPNPKSNNPIAVKINPHLFDWVVENLLRNALDAMGNKGEIAADVYQDNEFVNIDISDSGKGIPNSKFKTVFQPGYTTKKRGWGLGLSLAKRIIESYHSGRIFVKKSVINEGTTFTIRLPKE